MSEAEIKFQNLLFKLPFTPLKCRRISAEAMEPLKAPTNTVSEEEAKAGDPALALCPGVQEPLPESPRDRDRGHSASGPLRQ